MAMILKDFLSQQTLNQTDLKHLVSGLLNLSPADLILHAQDVVSPPQLDVLEHAVKRLSNGEPVYRILGWREFYGRRFYLNAATLEPRPDSETLIEAVKADFPAESMLSVLDLGTGTGCLILTLLAEFPNASAMATDISQDALDCAQRNADSLDVADRICFMPDDMLDSKIPGSFDCARDDNGEIPDHVRDDSFKKDNHFKKDDRFKKFDVIVSNPPYIPTKDVLSLDQHVQDFDPARALDGGDDGLDFYRAIAKQYQKWLNPGGKLYLEIGHDQGKSVPALFKNASVIQDYGGNNRVVVVA